MIDLSKETFTDDFSGATWSLVGLENLDYVITNHMEPDHSGALLRLRGAPNAKFLGMAKAVAMMKDFYNIVDNVEVVKHEQTSAWGRTSLLYPRCTGLRP